jgi:hypothetical protein
MAVTGVGQMVQALSRCDRATKSGVDLTEAAVKWGRALGWRRPQEMSMQQRRLFDALCGVLEVNLPTAAR